MVIKDPVQPHRAFRLQPALMTLDIIVWRPQVRLPRCLEPQNVSKEPWTSGQETWSHGSAVDRHVPYVNNSPGRTMQGTFGCDTFVFLPISDLEHASDADGPDLVPMRSLDEIDCPKTVGPSAKELDPHKADHMWWSARQTHLPRS